MKPQVLTLFTLSDHEIGQHIPSGGASDDDHVGGDVHGDQVLRFGKEEREKQKAQGKGDIHMSFLFW